MLGVGPTPEGLIQDEVVSRLKKIGNWLNANGKAIYNTQITPKYNDGNIWFTQSKDGKTIYAIYMAEEGKPLPTTITWSANIPKKGSSVKLVANGAKLKTKVTNGAVSVTLPKGMKPQSFAMEFTLDVIRR